MSFSNREICLEFHHFSAFKSLNNKEDSEYNINIIYLVVKDIYIFDIKEENNLTYWIVKENTDVSYFI